MKTKETQTNFEATKTMLLNTKNLIDQILNSDSNLSLIYCETKQDMISIEQCNINLMNDAEFEIFASKTIKDLLHNELHQLNVIYQWLQVLERAELIVINCEDVNPDWEVVKYCLDACDTLANDIDRLYLDYSHISLDADDFQKRIGVFFNRKRNIQCILNVLSISKTLSNDYLKDFPSKNPEFKRTVDMIVSLFTYPQIYNENFFINIFDRKNNVMAAKVEVIEAN